MDIPWGSEGTKKFVTNVGLITTQGPLGQNIMACEWTHFVSYSPALIAVCVGQGKATFENIKSSKAFGVNLAGISQNTVSGIAGASSGANVDKIKVLEDLGVRFYRAKRIGVPMLHGAALNAECRLVNEIVLGDHTMFVGEVLDVKTNSDSPLVYNQNKYWHIGQNIPKPGEKELGKIGKLVEKHKKKK